MGATGWAGLGQVGGGLPPRSSTQGCLAGTCRRDNRAGPTGCLGALAGGTSWRLSPAAAPAAGGPPSPAQPRWSTRSPAPGPRREHPESPGCWSVERSQPVGSRLSCVTSDGWLCLSEPHLFHGDSEAALLRCSEKPACKSVCLDLIPSPVDSYSGPPPPQWLWAGMWETKPLVPFRAASRPPARG